MNNIQAEQALMGAVLKGIYEGGSSKPEKMDKMVDTKLYVGNLSRQTTSGQLTGLFSQAGQVTGIEVAMDKISGISRGFAIVTMNIQSEAARAIGMFNNFSWDERILEVSLAE